MADEIDIEPEFEDEDSFRERLQKQVNQPGESSVSSGEPVIENDISGSTSGTPFPTQKPGSNKKREREIRDQEARERRRHRREQQERLEELRRQQAELRRQQDQQRREDMAASREAVRDIRSDAISDRVASYSLAAAAGLPGYVIGSVVDSVFIRPQEDRNVAAQKQYQRDLANYHEQVKRDREEAAYRQQQSIKNTPMQATVFDENGNPLPPTPPSGGGSGNITPPPVGNPVPPGWTPPPGARPPGGGYTPPPPGGRPPVPPPPPGQPPPVPPTPPTPGGSVFGGLATAVPIIVGAVELAQFLNRRVDAAGEYASNFGQSIVQGNNTEASKSLIKGAQTIYDPLGTNIPVNVAVQGFNTLLDVNQAILDTTRENLGFAPLSLQADIQSDINKLLRQIESSQKTDATTAAIIKANQDLDAAWNELRTKLINEFGPAIIAFLQILTQQLKGLSFLSELASPLNAAAVAAGPWAGALLKGIAAIVSNTEKDQIDQMNVNIFDQMKTFFDPNTPVKVR